MPVIRCQQCRNPLTQEEVQQGECPACHGKVVLEEDPEEPKPLKVSRAVREAGAKHSAWQKVRTGLLMLVLGSASPVVSCFLLMFLTQRRTEPFDFDQLGDPTYLTLMGLSIFVTLAIVSVGAAMMLFGIIRCLAAPVGSEFVKLACGGSILFIFSPFFRPFALFGLMFFMVFIASFTIRIAVQFSNRIQILNGLLYLPLLIMWLLYFWWRIQDVQPRTTEFMIVTVTVTAGFFVWQAALFWYARKTIHPVLGNPPSQ